MRPRLLDLFGKAGGAGHGYHLAGFEVTGVDIQAQPRYPHAFHQGEALEVLADPGFLAGFDVIHASPPCQADSVLRYLHRGRDHPRLVGPVRAALDAWGGPYVIENVPGAALPGALVLCGSEFGLSATCRDGRVRQLRRHRRFASNVFLMGAGGCGHHGQPVGVYGNGGGTTGLGYRGTKAEMAQAMGIDWMTVAELSQAIPPAYTQFIGGQLLDHLTATPTRLCAASRPGCG